MKKIILSALLIGGAAVAANAQANSVLVYGQLGIGTTKNANDDKSFHFNINPGVGYQFNDNWTAGLTGSFGTNRNKPDGAKEWTYTNSYSAGAFLRYTYPVSRIFLIYNQLEARYIGRSAGTTGSGGVKAPNVNGFMASMAPAVMIMVHKGFALNFGFGGIEFATEKTSGASSSYTSFDFTWGTQFNIGVSKNIFCGHKHRKGHMKMNHGSRIEKEDMEDDDKSEE